MREEEEAGCMAELSGVVDTGGLCQDLLHCHHTCCSTHESWQQSKVVKSVSVNNLCLHKLWRNMLKINPFPPRKSDQKMVVITYKRQMCMLYDLR